MENTRVVITGAARDFGRTLAIKFAELGAEVFLSARDPVGAERTRDEIAALGYGKAHATACDIADPTSVRAFASFVASRAPAVDVLINNAAGWLDGADLLTASDDEILATITSGGAGTILMTKHFLPLLKVSGRPDIVNMISAAVSPRSESCRGNPAFYAAKGAQATFADIMSQRLRGDGIRVISLFPPDFRNIDPSTEEWREVDRGPGSQLTAQSVLDCILFAVRQPRDCFIREFTFELMAIPAGS